MTDGDLLTNWDFGGLTADATLLQYKGGSLYVISNISNAFRCGKEADLLAQTYVHIISTVFDFRNITNYILGD